MFLKKNNFFQFISFLMLLFFIGDNSLAASEKRRRSVSPAGAASSVVVAGSVGDAEDSGEEEADVEEEAPIAGRHFYSRDYNLKLGAINLQEPLKRWHDEALAVVSRLSDECTSPNYAKASILYHVAGSGAFVPSATELPMNKNIYVSGWSGPVCAPGHIFLKDIYGIERQKVKLFAAGAEPVKEDWILKGCGFSKVRGKGREKFDFAQDGHSEQCFFSYVLRARSSDVIVSRDATPDTVIINLVSTNSPCPKCNRIDLLRKLQIS